MRTWGSWRFARHQKISLISLFLAAILLSLFVARFGVRLSGVMLLAGCLIIPVLRRPIGLGLFIAWLGAVVGLTRGQLLYNQLKGYQLLFNTQVAATGRVLDDPAYNEARNQTEFHLGEVSIKDHPLPGRIEVTTPRQIKIGRGDWAVTQARLKPANSISTQATLRFAEVTVTSSNTSWLERLRQRFFSVVKQALPEPAASLGLGYLVGLRADLPKSLSDQLALTGLSHIVAVSGYNLTIIAQAVRRTLARRSAYQSVLFSGLLVAAFVLIAGSSPPINRAAIICGFSLLAWYYGRRFQPMSLLLLGGAITAFINPINVWGDPSWYLSFLAFAGILLFAPLVRRVVYKNRSPGLVGQTLLETISAQLFTLPYSLYLFGGISIVAPLANLFVLPLTPVIMLLVFATGIVGMFVPAAAAIFGLIPSSLLTLQLWLIKHFSNFPLAHAEVSFMLWQMLGLFMVLTLITLGLWRRVKPAQLSESSNDYDLI